MKKATAPKKIMDAGKASRKLDRMAYQILEENHETDELFLIGIANKGYSLAGLIARRLKKFSDKKIVLTSIRLNKPDPVSEPVELGNPKISFKGQTIILIDDVGNTGRTLYYAMLPLAEHLPRSIQAAVLVDRMHKSFPICTNFIGHQLATTLTDEVIVEFDDKGKVEGAYLY